MMTAKASSTLYDKVAEPAAKAKTSIKVVFKLKEAATNFGQSARIVGSSKKLAGWDTSLAPEMTANNYPTWENYVQISEEDAKKLEYKYVITT